MKSIPLMMMAALAFSACDNAAAERSRDKSESKSRESDEDKPAAPKAAAAPTAAVTASAAAKPSASADSDDDDSPEIADATGAPPAPSAADETFKDVQIPAGVTIPTEEDYEEKAEKEITAANFEAALANIEKELAP